MVNLWGVIKVIYLFLIKLWLRFKDVMSCLYVLTSNYYYYYVYRWSVTMYSTICEQNKEMIRFRLHYARPII